MIILHIGSFENSFQNIMNSVIFRKQPIKKPVPAEKVIELSDKLLKPSVTQKDILLDYIKHGEQLYS